jgi:hypothetical protein
MHFIKMYTIFGWLEGGRVWIIILSPAIPGTRHIETSKALGKLKQNLQKANSTKKLTLGGVTQSAQYVDSRIN